MRTRVLSLPHRHLTSRESAKSQGSISIPPNSDDKSRNSEEESGDPSNTGVEEKASVDEGRQGYAKDEEKEEDTGDNEREVVEYPMKEKNSIVNKEEEQEPPVTAVMEESAPRQRANK